MVDNKTMRGTKFYREGKGIFFIGFTDDEILNGIKLGLISMMHCFYPRVFVVKNLCRLLPCSMWQEPDWFCVQQSFHPGYFVLAAG